MPEPFKAVFNRDLVAAIGHHLARHDSAFDADRFCALAGAGLDDLELKARSAQITAALEACLPADFPRACTLLIAALAPHPEGARADAQGLRGWAIMPMADFVAARGLDHFDLSMRTLAAMTSRFTSEGAVRPFIAADSERAMTWLLDWAGSPDPHVRRLASEGSRPRLPWFMQLRVFVADPAPLLPLLTRLRDDPSEYVRRSVANNLNDIAKDHPDLVAAIAADWMAEASPERARLIRHACRTLIKQGHPEALAALGFSPAQVALEALLVRTPVVRFGGALDFEAVLVSRGSAPQRIALDYIVHHVKGSGETRPKVFKWKVLTLKPDASLTLVRRHPMRPITTRRYHDGLHRVEIVANGRVLGSAAFRLTGAGGA